MASSLSIAEDSKSSTSTTIAEVTAHHSPKLDPNKKGFFDLPAELRNQIYAIVLMRSRKLSIIEWYPDCVILNNTRIYTSILRTCKKVHEEATPILYGANTFLLRSEISSWRFLNMIGRSREHVNKFETTWDVKVQLKVWKEVLAVSEYLIPEAQNAGYPFVVRLAKAVQDKRRTHPPCSCPFGSPGSDLRLLTVKHVESEIKRHCRTKEGRRKVFKLLFPTLDARAVEEDTKTVKAKTVKVPIRQPILRFLGIH